MNANILETLQQLDIDLESITDPGTRASVVLLLNIVEQLAQENQQFNEEVSSLKDEVNRLKGEQGRPKIRPQKKAGQSRYEVSPESTVSRYSSSHPARKRLLAIPTFSVFSFFNKFNAIRFKIEKFSAP